MTPYVLRNRFLRAGRAGMAWCWRMESDYVRLSSSSNRILGNTPDHFSRVRTDPSLCLSRCLLGWCLLEFSVVRRCPERERYLKEGTAVRCTTIYRTSLCFALQQSKKQTIRNMKRMTNRRQMGMKCSTGADAKDVSCFHILIWNLEPDLCTIKCRMSASKRCSA